MKMKKVLGAIALTATAAFVLSGCTDSAAEPDSGSSADASSSGELTSVRVAALPISESGAIWGAIDEGIFEDHGFDVEIVPAQGGAQAIPALLSGDIQFAIGQPFGPFRADLQDLGVAIIGNYANSLASGGDVNGVVSLADSGITGPADLAGKRVSVNSLGAAGDVTIMKAVEDAGGDPTSIEFVEVGFSDVQAQLDAGNIDAGWVPDPFMSQITGAGGNLVVYPYQATIPGLEVLTTITTQELIDSDPEMVTEFAAAMSDALDWAAANEDGVRAAIATNLEIPEEAAAGITLPEFTAELDVDNLQALAELAVGYGVLDAMPDFDRLVQIQ
ncbi:NitT/TauT family transport system substrate-binding protein [Microbacterium endophyticum]|uniref:ABC transporter substrate-binding protein n=1 Tax=Microbacterium endophyticum TaxID=1526412 RepID=UPI001F498BDC|nr:ABC transporter substrate-binding protein [Microbacterium endophyticum]NIK36173.1 NitT/TauT family transport system substrate-binding protein [Microbacterium endophyticum]